VFAPAEFPASGCALSICEVFFKTFLLASAPPKAHLSFLPRKGEGRAMKEDVRRVWGAGGFWVIDFDSSG